MQERVRTLQDAPARAEARHVLYRMRVNRRAESNHALAWAVELANRLDLPVLCCEEADDRFPEFVRDGAPETAQRLHKLGIGYIFDAGQQFPALAAEAAAVVTDEWPLPLPDPCVPGLPCYAVDSSCIVPMNRMEKREYGAYTIRPKIQRLLPQYLKPAPPVEVKRKYKQARPPAAKGSANSRGGRLEAERRLAHFLEHNLRRYAREKNEPCAHATSELSPYLHFGYISSLEVALAVREYADTHKLIADEFLEELIVRRELAFNFARFAPRVDSLDVLPDWARLTLRRHAKDRRDPAYSPEEFIEARTHDALWNATQREMLVRGKIHGYYRMYWGKKIVEWSRTHEEALATMIHIHDRYALDGCDPNTYTNILWCFGLHDRPFGERPIFGQVRYMSLAGMQRKTDVDAYIREIATIGAPG